MHVSRLVIFGAGGFGYDLLVAARAERREVVFLDDAAVDEELLPMIAHGDLRDDDRMVISVANGHVRQRIADRHCNFDRLVAPSAVVGAGEPGGVTVGEGAIVCDHAYLVPTARIGRHFHLNVYSYVSHDCVIGDFVTFAPKVCCNGNVHVGDFAYIGTGAMIANGVPGQPLKIGRNAIVGMGSVVTKDVPDNAVVYGNPAKIVRYRDDVP